MAISYVGGQVSARAGATTANVVTFSLSGGSDTVPRANDLVIVTLVVGSQGRDPTMTITTPSGYTNLTRILGADTYDASVAVAYKRMGATPDSNVTLPSTGNIDDAQACAIQVFRGVDASTPLDTANTNATGANTSRPNPAAITPVTPGAWVVICGGGAAATGSNYTAPTNFTTNFLTTFAADTNDALVGMGYWNGWTSGAVDPAQYGGGSNTTADSWGVFTLALRPQYEVQITWAAIKYVTSEAKVSWAELEATKSTINEKVRIYISD